MAGESIKDSVQTLKDQVEQLKARRGESAAPETEPQDAADMDRPEEDALGHVFDNDLKELKEAASHLAQVMEREIRTRPLTSVGVAFVTGFVLARLLGR